MTAKTLVLCIAMMMTSPLASVGQSTAEMKMEAGEALTKSDKAMNVAYQKLMGILNDEGKTRLREAQRAWLAFRDAQAWFDCHHFAGGTAEGLERLGSLAGLTDERTKTLLEDYKRFKEIFE